MSPLGFAPSFSSGAGSQWKKSVVCHHMHRVVASPPEPADDRRITVEHMVDSKRFEFAVVVVEFVAEDKHQLAECLCVQRR